jgi:hypothetical protein
VLGPQMHGPALIARTGCAAALVAPAWEYMRIRALAAPAVLLTMASQVPRQPWLPFQRAHTQAPMPVACAPGPTALTTACTLCKGHAILCLRLWRQLHYSPGQWKDAG